jgi:hypothetical protein
LLISSGVNVRRRRFVSFLFAGTLALAGVGATAVLPAQQAGAATCRPALRGLAVSPASVPGGAPAVATVTLTCAPPAAVKVKLAGFKGVTVPGTLTVARGKASATVTVKTATTTAARHGAITAALGPVRKSAAVAVAKTPRSCAKPVLTGFTVPSLAYVGQHPVATITLSCAPTIPIRLAFASSNAYLPAPATVTVGRYYDSALVTLAPEKDTYGQYASALTVKDGAASLARSITVDPGLSELQIVADPTDPDAIELNTLFTGIVPTGGLTVKYASSSKAVSVPASYTFTQGLGEGGMPALTVQPVTANTPVTISATLGSTTLKASYTLLPPFTSQGHLTVSAEAGSGPVYGADSFLEYTVTLSGPAPASGMNVTLSSGNAALEVQSPAATFIPAGFTTGYFTVNVAASVENPVHTKLTATAGNGVTGTLPVVLEPGLDTFEDVSTVTSSDQPTYSATIVLAGPVDVATTVQLQSDDGAVQVPLSVVVAAGTNFATFPVTTASVSSTMYVNLTATLGNTSLESPTITVFP